MVSFLVQMFGFNECKFSLNTYILFFIYLPYFDRYCMSTIINAANQFKNIFSTNGYFLIMPDLLRIYSNNQVSDTYKNKLLNGYTSS